MLPLIFESRKTLLILLLPKKSQKYCGSWKKKRSRASHEWYQMSLAYKIFSSHKRQLVSIFRSSWMTSTVTIVGQTTREQIGWSFPFNLNLFSIKSHCNMVIPLENTCKHILFYFNSIIIILNENRMEETIQLFEISFSH